jgi:hypothetical protein
LTHDIDVVLHIAENDLETFASAFNPGSFSCPPKDLIRVELNRPARGHFHVIHHETGFKADIFLAGKEELQWWAMNNIQRIEMSGMAICVAPPEYAIIKKLEYYKEGGSQKHLSDTGTILAHSRENINFKFLRDKMMELGLDDVGKNILDQSSDTTVEGMNGS